MEKYVEEKLNILTKKQNKYIKCALEKYIMPNIIKLEKSFEGFKYIYNEKGFIEVEIENHKHYIFIEEEDNEQYYVAIPYGTEEFRTSVGNEYNSFHEVLFAIWSLYHKEKQIIIK